MTDTQIIDLYWARSEEAILATADTYGGYCAAIAWNILHSREDTEECVNDTWHRAWQSMPPERPNPLRVWLGKITRNLALDRWRASRAGKRGGGQLEALLSELEGCLPAGDSPERQAEDKEPKPSTHGSSPCPTPLGSSFCAATGTGTAWPTSPRPWAWDRGR